MQSNEEKKLIPVKKTYMLNCPSLSIPYSQDSVKNKPVFMTMSFHCSMGDMFYYECWEDIGYENFRLQRSCFSCVSSMSWLIVANRDHLFSTIGGLTAQNSYILALANKYKQLDNSLPNFEFFLTSDGILNKGFWMVTIFFPYL